MTWEGFYLLCFVVGFALAVLGFVSGALHWPTGHFLHDAGHGLHPPAHGAAAHTPGGPGTGAGSVSPYNFATIMAFLAWFGGTGYLLAHRGSLGRLIVLAAAVSAGLVGSALVFGFLTRVLLKHERFLDAADFEMVGVLGRVTVSIRSGGTGEIVYSQAGTRRSAGARSDEAGPIDRETEVVVTRFEKGIAYVRPWEELTGRTPRAPAPPSLS
jgi:hypothetical protein